MVTLLSKLFIREPGEYKKPEVRRGYGIVCSVFGIFLNVLLFSMKLFASIATGSVAIMADAFNNLSDAGSSAITLAGFKFAGRKPDREHPFGHGRYEYVAGLVVALLIILMGLELINSSVGKILHPAVIRVQWFSVGILAVSVLVKLYMAFYNYQTGKKIESTAMYATAMDSLSDSVATAVVLLSMLAEKLTGINVDGYCGVVVACFILWTGYQSIKETLGPLLGGKPNPELINRIQEIVLSHQKIQGVHDVIVHDYGPGRIMISLHAEVPGDEDIFILHDLIERIEEELNAQLYCESVIHMDPIEANNEIVMSMREKVSELVLQMDDSLTIHDFRMVSSSSFRNLIFDVVIPQEYGMSDEEVSAEVSRRVVEKYPDCRCIIKVEKAYI